jgi:hypothetical protein
MSFNITPQRPDAGPKENIQEKYVVTLTGNVKLGTLTKLSIKPFIKYCFILN